ncbi:MAG: aldehyde dehydrogenase family protein, partial [Pseudomonadota bacterium]
RCTCARRLIVPQGKDNDLFIETFIQMVKSIKIGRYNDTPEPFMGALISNKEAERMLKAQDDLIKKGGKVLIKMERLDKELPFVSPALIDMSDASEIPDVEYFGPLLQLIRTPDLETAVKIAGNTKYGLSSGIFCDKKENFEYFLKNIRAGVINWNRPLTGSSGNLPFGGVGLSGNHRPAGYFSSDYAAYPVASNEALSTVIPEKPTPGIFV